MFEFSRRRNRSSAAVRRAGPRRWGDVAFAAGFALLALVVVVLAAAQKRTVSLDPLQRPANERAGGNERRAESPPEAAPAQPAASYGFKGTVTAPRPGRPLVLRELAVRVQGIAQSKRATDGRLSVRLRVRNLTRTRRKLDLPSGQIYLSVGGRPVPAESATGVTLASGGARNVTVVFRFDSSAAAFASSRRGQIRLVVVPFSQVGRQPPQEAGLVGLSLPAE